MDETARGIPGFLARRIRTGRFLLTSLRFTLLYFTKAREVRRRYAEAERSGKTIWLDRGPFRGGDERS